MSADHWSFLQKNEVNGAAETEAEIDSDFEEADDCMRRREIDGILFGLVALLQLASVRSRQPPLLLTVLRRINEHILIYILFLCSIHNFFN